MNNNMTQKNTMQKLEKLYERIEANVPPEDLISLYAQLAHIVEILPASRHEALIDSLLEVGA